MPKSTVTSIFYLKRHRERPGDPLQIYQRITVDGKRVEISTKRECEPERWNSAAGRKNGTKEDVRELNFYLDALQQKFYEAHRSLVERGGSFTADELKNLITGANERPRLLMEIFRHHNHQMAQLVGKDFALGTYKRYKVTYNHTSSFLAWKFKCSDISISRVDFGFISDFEFYLKSVAECAHNTAIKNLIYFKKIILLCVKNGWLERDPFAAFRMSHREVTRNPLTEVELKKIEEKELQLRRLNEVRDIFLFSCYTGLAYSDIAKLRDDEIADGFDSKKWLVIKRQKTDTPSRVPLLELPSRILEKYRDHPICVNKGLVLPILSNQKMNDYLKEVAVLCGIRKKISFHLARHTFATTVTLANGVSIETVSKMLGHRNIKTTQIYAKVIDLRVSQEMDGLAAKLMTKAEKRSRKFQSTSNSC